MPKISKSALPLVIVLLFGFAGIMISVLLQYLNDNGIIVDEFIVGSSTITLPEVMALNILVWLLFGVVIAVAVS